jgi:hypothetical protein
MTLGALDQAIHDYHALITPDYANQTFRILEAGQIQRRMLVGKQRDRLVCSVIRPRFVVPAQYTRLLTATESVGQALLKVGTASLQHPEILRPYALSPIEQQLLLIDPGYAGASVFGRLDGFLDPNGLWCSFVESNLESPAGIAYDEAIATLFEQTPLMNAFRQHYECEALPVRQGLQQLLLDTYQEWGGTQTPSIAIVDFRSAVTMSEFEHLRDRFQADGIPTMIADPADLSYHGGKLYANNTPIDLVYRRILQHEFLAQYDLNHPLVQAYADRAVCVINPFRSKPVHTKLIMWLLSDEEGPAAGILSPDEQAACAQYIPWSRFVQPGATRYRGERVDLLAFARTHREQLVLKPNDEYGGKGVLLGWQTDPTTWEAALDAAVHTPHILQERVPLPEEPYPTWTPDEGVVIANRYVDSDPLVYGEMVVGCLTRIATTALLNVSAGGGSAPPTFLVRPLSSSQSMAHEHPASITKEVTHA